MMRKPPVRLKASPDLLRLPSHSREQHPIWTKLNLLVCFFRKSLERYDLSSSAQEILMASWRSGTSKQYQSYLNRWKSYCQEHNVDLFNPDLKYPIEFLVSLYKTGLGYSAINTARSALSTILICRDGYKFGEHPLVCRYMKGVFRTKTGVTEIFRNLGRETCIGLFENVYRPFNFVDQGTNFKAHHIIVPYNGTARPDNS